ncbi:hypothetical protein HCY95_01056 [Limosilactobacillus fermentum]|uniref:Transposase IS30-like HTH domain-containing protein n=1 Tax=Limosilactobacillus fermentum TaxID=1613 RepID=A0AAJ4GFC9_LIMFE|nr:hypothetical protein HCY95_01056 [Limosilactobacillus fermentum]
MSTTILSFQNRVVIETLHNEGRSLRYIANYLGFSKTTIFNELHRLNSEYQAGLAQTDFERKVSQRGRKSSLTKNLKHLIEEKIQVQKWSPEQVAHVVGIAYKTVYNWIDQGWLDVQLPDLPDHGIRRHRAKEKRGTFNHGRSVVRSITAAPLRSVLIKSKLARNSATLKLIPYFLVNVKVRLWLLLWNVRAA